MAGLIEQPLVSVIIVNYNGINFIESCLRSVLNSNYSNLEVIFVDNASKDNSLKLLNDKFGFDHRLKVIANKKGIGPAKGRNLGIQNSNGKYTAFLDNDTEVDPNWLEEPIRLFESNKSLGAAQAKILLFDRQTIDTCGHYLSIIGFPYEIGAGEIDKGQYDYLFEIFGARSAAMFIRKDLLDKIGYFDPDYFMHSEETDLSWRVWLQGYKIVFVPQSIVFHKRGGSTEPKYKYLMFYESSKNCTKTLIKNLGLGRLLLILPLHIAAWFAISALFLIKGRLRDTKAIIQGLLWVLFNMKHILKERKVIQLRRVNKDSQIISVIMGSHGALSLVKKGLSWIGRIYA